MLDRATIAQLDTQNMVSSIEVLDKQCKEAWNATKALPFPESYKNVQNIVLFGMGGSALGMDIVQTLFSDQIAIPITIVSDYHIPASVNQHTLAILSSYSGTTEEVVTISKTIQEKTNNIVVICTGGDLATFASENSLPAYIFEPTHNPSQQPRMAVGYSVMGTLGALNAMGHVQLSDDEVNQMLTHLQSLHAKIGADVEEAENRAKQLATTIHPYMPIYISSEFLLGSTHVFTNQTNENGKQFAARFPIPELNHHLIEGLVHPRTGLDQLIFVFITSTLYHERNQQRHTITREVAERNAIKTTQLHLEGDTKLKQAFELLTYGSYISLYAAILNNIDPSPIPNVDFLKDELKKS